MVMKMKFHLHILTFIKRVFMLAFCASLFEIQLDPFKYAELNSKPIANS